MQLEEYKDFLRCAIRSNNSLVKQLALEALNKANESRDTMDQIMIHYLLETQQSNKE